MADCLKLLLAVLLTLIGCFSAASGQDVPPETYSELHCLFCPPGTYVKEKCKAFYTNSTCATCGAHHYYSKPNSQDHCDLCKPECPKNSRTLTNCTPTSNKQCLCLDGYHQHPLDPIDDHWSCRQHFECLEGEGEVHYGNYTHNTRCQKCQKGLQFLNKSDPGHPVCQDCTGCDPDDAVLKECSLDSDTQCGVGENGTGSTISLPSADSTPAAEDSSDEQSLSAGAIFAIVYGSLLAVGIIAGGLYIFFSGRNQDGARKWQQILGWILGILLGCGLCIVLACLVSNRRRPNNGRTDAPTSAELKSLQGPNGAGPGEADPER